MPAGKQLEFRFDTDHDVTYYAMDGAHAREFMKFIKKLNPGVVVDLRYVPRFDLRGAPRHLVVNSVHSCIHGYVQASVPLHIAGSPSEWVRIGELVRALIIERGWHHGEFTGPVLLLVDRDISGRMISGIFADIMWQLTRRQWFSI